jgi:hypothetical protein
MTLTPSISQISPSPPPPKARFLSSSKIRREIVGFGNDLFGELVPFVEVTLVSKFHPIWCSSSRIKFGKKGVDFGRKSRF